jgi:hypothetical protein
MSARDTGSLIQIGPDVLNTEVDPTTKTVLAHLGDVVGSEAGGAAAVDGDRAEWWQHVGLISRPPKPEAGKSACQTVTVRQSGHDAVIASRDLRGQDLAGDLGHGETCLYAAGEDGRGQAKIKLCKDGTVALYTKKGNVSTGVGMAIMIDPASDAIRITNSKGYGIIIDADGVKILAGATGMVLEPSRVVVKSGGAVTLDGGTIALGGTASPATPALCGPACTPVSGVPSTKVFVALG